jgi:RNA polymerase sigma factor (TIGR02999 family)
VHSEVNPPESGERPTSGEITRELARIRAGEQDAFDRLFPLIYDDLRARARRHIGRHTPGETLNTTALVHETYLKLVDAAHRSYADRVHFFSVASLAMRQILVDHARTGLAKKRGGGAQMATIDPADLPSPDRGEDLLALDEALTQLAKMDARLARTVELRYFGGLSVEEAAEVLGVSARTVKRDWRTARAFLYDAVKDAE